MTNETLLIIIGSIGGFFLLVSVAFLIRYTIRFVREEEKLLDYNVVISMFAIYCAFFIIWAITLFLAWLHMQPITVVIS